MNKATAREIVRESTADRIRAMLNDAPSITVSELLRGLQDVCFQRANGEDREHRPTQDEMPFRTSHLIERNAWRRLGRAVDLARGTAEANEL